LFSSGCRSGHWEEKGFIDKLLDFCTVCTEIKELTMSDTPQYGLEQARAQLPLIASEAVAGYTSVITRHGKPVAVVVPVEQWRDQQVRALKQGGVLALRGSGRGLWPEGAAPSVAQLRDEWA
jgi:prevent-host-death family protein